MKVVNNKRWQTALPMEDYLKIRDSRIGEEVILSDGETYVNDGKFAEVDYETNRWSDTLGGNQGNFDYNERRNYDGFVGVREYW